MEFAESVHQFLQKDRASDIPLACEYPTGAIAEPAAMRKVAGGILIQDSEKELLETAMLQRGVLQAMTQMAGAPDDAAKTLEMFKAGEAKVARPTFVFAAAKALHDRSELFGSRKLDQPNKLQALCSEADEALKSIPETKDTKALSKKIQAALKKVKGGV